MRYNENVDRTKGVIIMTVATDERLNALADFLEVDVNELEESNYYDNGYAYGNQEYLVLTDEEADEKAREEIEQTLWAFNTDFILRHCSTYGEMDCYEFEQAEKALRKAQAECCESLNGLVKALIEDMEDFVEDAIMSDGRGHFISYYDGYENEQGDYYIYRV